MSARECLCEHGTHWTPTDAAEHAYGQHVGDDVVDVDTVFGVFPMCKACRDAQHDYPMMGRDLPLTTTP